MTPYTFELFAPYNKIAGLRLKNANARMFGLDIPMELNEEDGYWRATLDLPDGIYHYQYKVVTKSWFEPEPEPAVPEYNIDETKTSEENEQIRKDLQTKHDKQVEEVKERNKKREEELTFTEVWYTFVDPYATEVDERGSDDSFRSVGVLIFKNGRKIVDEYEWKYDNHVPLVSNEKLIIYEIHIGDFEDKFVNVTARMNYFVQLGITAVEMMPVKEFPGQVGWGYTPRYHFAIQSTYGTTAELKEMIDTFHKNGIRVIMDGVYNHCDVSAPYTAIDHDYWFLHDPKDPVWCWGPEWDYEKYDEKYKLWPARKYIGESIRYFIDEFHIDGIRFDAATQIANDKFLKILVQQIKQQARERGFGTEFYCVGEYLPDKPEYVISNGGPMDGVWHDSFYLKLRESMSNEPPKLDELKDVIDARRQGYQNITDVVNYQSNHDHNRLLVDLGKEYQLFDDEAFRRVRMAFAIQATSFGLMMIWMGAEIGEYKEKTPGIAKIDWTLIEDRDDNSNAINKKQLQYYKDVINLRKLNLALTSPNLEFIFEDECDLILAWHRWNPPIYDTHNQGDHVIIICNWAPITYEKYEILNIPRNGRWYEWLNNDEEYIVENNKLIIEDFKDHSVRIFVYQNSSFFPISNTTISTDRKHFIIIHSKIISIIGILLIPIILICLIIIYYFYKQYLKNKYHQETERCIILDNEQISSIDIQSNIQTNENDSTIKYQFM
ncbi:unnamed protein product [Rotaria sordida]|uniref:Glycosyl hydrolase family 13 catalytic domain-containing protein n=2 Tax=Rotaria sordida TaxID=392033 RepID=A0A814KAP0_9BILA|nr:unnamed protein product [Rotaria sordida]